MLVTPSTCRSQGYSVPDTSVVWVPTLGSLFRSKLSAKSEEVSHVLKKTLTVLMLYRSKLVTHVIYLYVVLTRL